jgi:hypothetical protein
LFASRWCCTLRAGNVVLTFPSLHAPKQKSVTFAFDRLIGRG